MYFNILDFVSKPIFKENYREQFENMVLNKTFGNTTVRETLTYDQTYILFRDYDLFSYENFLNTLREIPEFLEFQPVYFLLEEHDSSRKIYNVFIAGYIKGQSILYHRLGATMIKCLSS